MTASRTVAYGTTAITYDLIFADRKTLGIDVSPDRHVTVKAPYGTPTLEIDGRVQKRAAWILRQQREFENYPPELPPRQYVSGESHRYLGKQYRLKVIEAEVESVKLTRGRFMISVSIKQITDHVKRLLDDWYRKQARRVFAERLAACYLKAKRFGIPYPELSIRSMEKRWGSCSAEGRLILNLKLIQVPKPYIDYVILHELCHLKEHHHGPAFYALMDRLLPDWREKRAALHQVELT